MKFKPVSRLYTIFSLFFIISILLLISSCDTAKPFLKTAEPPLQVVEQNGVQVECLYLNYNDMEKRHGWKANPFLPPDLGLTPQQMIVFELKITNKENAPVVLSLKNIELFFGDKRFIPLSGRDMEAKIDDFADEKTDKLKENSIAQEFMLPGLTTIKDNRTQKGYLVFMGAFRGKDIPTELFLSFTTPDKKTAADITFNYTLTLIKK